LKGANNREYAVKGKTMKRITTIAVLLLSATSIIHLLRLIFQWEVLVNGMRVKFWLSIIGFIVPAALAVLLWMGNKDDD